MTTPRTVRFEVTGTPMPQGSKKAFAVNGQARMKETGGLKFAAWRNQVSEAARREAETLDTPLDGALTLHVTFWFPMPASRPKKIKALGQVPKTTAPDTSKLCRLVEDSLQAAGLITDDARIAHLEARKWETATGWTGATITVTEGAG
jgi:Holliday junction resolvase RusA-like endonuclease